jgi:hypothetical protein
MEMGARSDPAEIKTNLGQKKACFLFEAGHGRLLPRACRFGAYPVPSSRVDDRRKAR